MTTLLLVLAVVVVLAALVGVVHTMTTGGPLAICCYMPSYRLLCDLLVAIVRQNE
jgi:hypothetical protein